MPMPQESNPSAITEEKHDAIAYHPALPTIAEAKADYQQVTSDHVPYLVSIPLDKQPLQSGQAQEIKIVSWNVLQSDAYNGFAPVGNRGTYGETKEEENARHERIATSIAKFSQVYEPQFITLQEISATSTDTLYKMIKDKLGDHYDFVKCHDEIVDLNGCITLYNKKQFEVSKSPEFNQMKGFKYSALGGIKTNFSMIGNPEFKINIANIHADFNHHPVSHENNVKTFLNGDEDSAVSVVIGDFNCNIAPVVAKKKNITTSVAPEMFRNGMQGACAIDGCFYSLNHSGNKQAEIHHLDPKTGSCYTDDQLSPIETNTLNPAQKNEIESYRMIMCVDDTMRDAKICENDEFTLLTYQIFLQKQFNSSSMIVRFSRNLNNENGLSIELSKEVFDELEKTNNPNFQLDILDNSSGACCFYVVSAADRNIPELKKAIQKSINARALKDFNAKIDSLEAKSIDPGIISKFRALSETILCAPIYASGEPYATIIEHFTKEAENPSLSLKSVEDSAIQLDNKLFGKPPIKDLKVKVCICALLGALSGIVVEAAVVAAFTVSTGGFGAFVAVMLGAAKGFGLVDIGTAAAGTMIGGAASFFSTRSKQEEYNAAKRETIAKIDKNVVGAMVVVCPAFGKCAP